MPDAVRHLRALILAGEQYRQAVSNTIGLGGTESQAISYLAVHGDCGQSDLARGLSLTSSASTALVDRLERQGVAERIRHPRDRRRSIIRLTERGRQISRESQRWLAASLEHIEPDQLGVVCHALGAISAELSLVAQRVRKGELEAVPTHALPAA